MAWVWGNACTDANWGGYRSRTIIIGKGKWVLGLGGPYYPACAHYPDDPWRNPDWSLAPDAPCGDPYTCWDGPECTTCGWYNERYANYYYYEWGCN